MNWIEALSCDIRHAMKKKKILIVDDQVEIIRYMATHLAVDPRYEVINANDGELAYTLAEEKLPDLIIMDWDMPVMNGLETTRKLKHNQVTFDIPVIIATGRMTTSEDLSIALEAGAIDYIRKPIDFVELNARINTAFRIKEQNDSISTLLKEEVELKNRKLSTASMLMVEKNGLLQDFATDLDRIEKSLSESPKSVEGQVKMLKKRINSHLEVDSSWETFQLHFDEVHPDFFNTLDTKYPKLSHKDLKLAAYLKMGLDNKQIARLLNIEPSSTRTALTRFKRKLAIPDEENLRQFIARV